jgi:hypothetical protein
MILGAEIGVTIYGLMALIRGKFSMGKNREIVGLPARMLGLLCLATLPLVIGLGFVVGFAAAMNGKDLSTANPLQFIWIDIVVLVSIFLCVTLIGKWLYNNQQTSMLAAQSPDLLRSSGPHPDNPYAS